MQKQFNLQRFGIVKKIIYSTKVRLWCFTSVATAQLHQMCRPCFISLLPLLLWHDSQISCPTSLFFDASEQFILLRS